MIDSHAHLTSPPLWEEIDLILARAKEAGLSAIINICTNTQDIEHSQQLSKLSLSPSFFYAAGVHPHDADKQEDEFFSLLSKQARDKELVAIGEIGLDYHYAFASKEKQQEVLKQHLHLARECQLPIIIHCREAFHDLFSILDFEYSNCPAVLHCFTGTKQEAEAALQRGLYLSFSGIITFKKSEELRDIVHCIPLERLLIETDAPFLAPQSRRGKRNEPAYIVETAETVASIKQIPLKELIRVTSQNVYDLFAINKRDGELK